MAHDANCGQTTIESPERPLGLDSAASASTTEGGEEMSGALAIDTKALFDTQSVAEGGVLNPVTPTESKQTPAPTNITTFPNEGTVDIKAVVVKMMLEGKTSIEIGELLNKTPEVIEKLMQSELITKALQNAIAQDGDDEGQDSIRSLLRAYSPMAVQQLPRLMKCNVPQVELNAVKTVLEYVLLPAKERDVPTRSPRAFKGGDSPEKLEARHNELQEQIARERAKKRL